MVKKYLWLLGTTIVILVSCRPSEIGLDGTPPRVTPSPGVERRTTIVPLPNYLGMVVPKPGGSYTVAEYESIAPSLGWGATVPGICFSIFPFRFMEAGDFPTAEEWLTRVHLTVDDQIITEYHSLLKTDSEGYRLVDPKTNEVVWQEPAGSPLCLCYAVPLGVGWHNGILVVDKTSGEQIAYAWSFVITD